jgi:DNA adenine methylase
LQSITIKTAGSTQGEATVFSNYFTLTFGLHKIGGGVRLWDMESGSITFLRYAGSKRRSLSYIKGYLQPSNSIPRRYIDPFVGGGVIFLSLDFKTALLSDINRELMDLYRAIKEDPLKVWLIFKNYPSTKKEYYRIRNDKKVSQLDLIERAARTLYLNRTCFRGWWRYNAKGQFNVGYGGQGRRWAITEEDLVAVSRKLANATLQDGDFEDVINSSQSGDFIFADPPYQPGEREMSHEHYVYSRFGYDSHKRLAETLKSASTRGVRWAVTTSSHPDILSLFSDTNIVNLPKDPFKRLRDGLEGSGEVLIRNYSGNT